jgi:hypothetical protein
VLAGRGTSGQRQTLAIYTQSAEKLPGIYASQSAFTHPPFFFFFFFFFFLLKLDTMADDNAEPGAPTPQAADKASDRVTSKAVSVPNSALSAVKQVDRVILRLNK